MTLHEMQREYLTEDTAWYLRPQQAMWIDEATSVDQTVFTQLETAQMRPHTEFKMSYEEFLKGMFFDVKKKPVGRNPL